MLVHVFLAFADALSPELRCTEISILASLDKYLQKAFLANFSRNRQILKIFKSAWKLPEYVRIKNFFRQAGKEEQRELSLR